MSERPILMSAPMVRALLAGTKTVTRRVVAEVGTYPGRFDGAHRLGPLGYRGILPSTYYLAKRLHAAYRRSPGEFHWLLGAQDGEVNPIPLRCPYGEPGTRLWVREGWMDCDADGTLRAISYRADPEDAECTWLESGVQAYEKGARLNEGRWRSPIHMPRWASRITLQVESVRVERLQAITEEDARAEGVEPVLVLLPGMTRPEAEATPSTRRAAFALLWDSINGKRAPWSSNPWVWRVEFSRVDATRA